MPQTPISALPNMMAKHVSPSRRLMVATNCSASAMP
jgi:hypothetical protein